MNFYFDKLVLAKLKWINRLNQMNQYYFHIIQYFHNIFLYKYKHFFQNYENKN